MQLDNESPRYPVARVLVGHEYTKFGTRFLEVVGDKNESR